jgi:hypothetical protein
MNDRLTKIIAQATSSLGIEGKCGQKILQPTIASALRAEGYIADKEDKNALLPARLPVWRSKNTGLIEETRGRRLIDIVVYQEGRLVALIETESDLNDLLRTGISKRSGHYDVNSIARDKAGNFFNSDVPPVLSSRAACRKCPAAVFHPTERLQMRGQAPAFRA